MTDIVYGYPYLTAGIDTTTRFFPGLQAAPPATDSILMTDTVSFILLIDGTTTIGMGH